MPASLFYEESALNQVLKKEAWTATKSYLGLSKIKTGLVLKKTTGTEFWNEEPSEGSGKNGWARQEIDAIEWTVTKSETATGETIYENKNAITLSTLSGGEFVLETFAVCDALTAGHILVYGNLEEKITLNKSTTEFTVPAKALKVKCE